MDTVWKRIASVVFAVFIAAGLTFGATQALNLDVDPAHAEAVQMNDEFCGDHPGEYDGVCTSKDDDPDCEDKCEDEHGTTGGCVLTEHDGWCCMCQV